MVNPAYIYTAFTLVYLLGAILHYLHVIAVLNLTGYSDQADMSKVYFSSLVWPITTIRYMYEIVTVEEEEEDSDD